MNALFTAIGKEYPTRVIAIKDGKLNTTLVAALENAGLYIDTGKDVTNRADVGDNLLILLSEDLVLSPSNSFIAWAKEQTPKHMWTEKTPEQILAML